MKNKHFVLCLFLLYSVLFSAQSSTQSFSLKEAIDYALAHNTSAKNAVRDIEAAKQQKWETTASGLPQINAGIDYQNFLKQQVSVVPNAFFDNRQGVINTVEEFFNLQANGSPQPLDGFSEIIFGTKQNVNASATLTQLIFDGSYLVGLQSAKVFLEISKNAKAKTDLEIRKRVIDAYGNVLLAEETVNILKRNIEVLEKNVTETTKIYENGLGDEESVEQLQITLSGVKSSLNNTRRLKTLAYQMFNLTIGKPIDETSVLTDNLENLTTQHINLELLNKEASVENTLDFKIAENDTKAKTLLLKLEKSKALPSLSGFLNGGYLGFSDSFTFLDKEQIWSGFSAFGFSLNLPLFSSGKRSAATQRARINLEKSKDLLSETEQKLKLEVAAAKSDYQFVVEDYENKKQNLNLAERIEKKNQTKYYEGIASSFELRQAQTQLYKAQQEFLQAMLDVINKKATLETVLHTINN